MTINFDSIKKDYSMPDIVSASGVKLVRNGKEFIGCCPFHNEKSESFTVYQSQRGWRFHCFGCGASGDNVDYVGERYGVNRGDAARIITGDDRERQPVKTEWKETHNPYSGYKIIEPPASASPLTAKTKTPPLLNPKRLDANGEPKRVTYTPSMVFPYRNPDGSLMGYVLRVDIDHKKLTPGIWWMKNEKTGFEGWSHGPMPEPRMLYGLDRLAAAPQKQVLLVEGEKCADAAQRLLGGVLTCVTWPGGGKSVKKADWSALTGKSVIIWPDNDQEGWRTTIGYWQQGQWHKGLCELLFAAGVKTLKIVHIPVEQHSKGWDIADAEAEGLGAEGVTALIKAHIQPWTPERFSAWKKKEIEKGEGDGDWAKGTDVEDEEQHHRINDTALVSDRKKNDDANRSGLVIDRRRSEEAGSGSTGGEEDREIRGFGISDQTWRSHLIMKQDGEGLKNNSLQNFALLLQYEPRFAGIFAWNDFAKEVFLLRRPPWDVSEKFKPRVLNDADVTSAACWLEYCGMTPKTNDVGKVIVRVAQHNSYNPVMDGFKSLKWDGISRLQRGAQAPWMTYYLGAEDTEINRLFGMKWLIAGVARTFQPGCKMDTMLILEGEQGLRKSTALRFLADAVADGIFTDEMSDPNSKDAGLQMQGRLIVEISELDSFRKADVRQIKSWLARQVDRFRRPYGKIVEDFPRSGIIAGTMNPSGTGYFQDASGARRFWPVMLNGIDLQALKQDAPQLWAEAVHLYQHGFTWWLDKEEEDLARSVQAVRYEDDPWSELIDKMLTARTRITLNEIMQNLDIAKEKRSTVYTRRIASHLHTKGWLRRNDATGRTIYCSSTMSELPLEEEDYVD